MLNNLIQIEADEKIFLSVDSFRKISFQFIARGLLVVVHPDHSNYYDFVQESRYRLTKEGQDYLIKLLEKKKQ